MAIQFKDMIKLSLLSSMMFVLFSSHLEAKTIYQQKNNPVNYVKIKKIKGKYVDSRVTTHPAVLTQAQMEDFLSSLRMSRSLLFRQNFKDQRIFNDPAIVKIAPHLVQAFQEITPFEHVSFSIVVKNPMFIVRNDHLTQGVMWVHGNDLHVKFTKLHAKLQGDYKARGNGQRITRNAKGLRISLEATQGQKLSFDNAGEIIIDMKAPWGTILTELARKDDLNAKKKKKWTFRKKKKEGLIRDNQVTVPAPTKTSSYQAPAPIVSNPVSGSTESRLQELKRLKKQGLINQSDYNRKKSEILKSL